MPGSGLHRQLKIQVAWTAPSTFGKLVACMCKAKGLVILISFSRWLTPPQWDLNLSLLSLLLHLSQVILRPQVSRNLQARQEVPFSHPGKRFRCFVSLFTFSSVSSGSFVSLLRVTTCLLVSLLLLLMSCLCESLSVHAFQGFEPIQAQAHPRKRITSRITPRCKVPPFSRRFQGFFLFQDCCGHTVVLTHLSGLSVLLRPGSDPRYGTA